MIEADCLSRGNGADAEHEFTTRADKGDGLREQTTLYLHEFADIALRDSPPSIGTAPQCSESRTGCIKKDAIERSTTKGRMSSVGADNLHVCRTDVETIAIGFQ